MIVCKSPGELEIMREAGRITAGVARNLREAIKPGVTTAWLDELAETCIREAGGTPAFKGYQGFPASICASINDEVVHGIPGPVSLQDGDILSIDVGVFHQGFCGDTAFTVGVGSVSPEAERLMEVTRESLARGIGAARYGGYLTDISHAVQQYVESQGFSVVRDYVGHGIGRRMHEDPQLPNFGPPGNGPILREGMTLAIEPMVNIGGYAVKVDTNKWTVRTVDGSLSAHYEHTIAVGSQGPVVLTAE